MGSWNLFAGNSTERVGEGRGGNGRKWSKALIPGRRCCVGKRPRRVSWWPSWGECGRHCSAASGWWFKRKLAHGKKLSNLFFAATSAFTSTNKLQISKYPFHAAKCSAVHWLHRTWRGRGTIGILKREWRCRQYKKLTKTKTITAFQNKNALKTKGVGGREGASYYLFFAFTEAGSSSTKILQVSKFPNRTEGWRGISW